MNQMDPVEQKQIQHDDKQQQIYVPESKQSQFDQNQMDQEHQKQKQQKKTQKQKNQKLQQNQPHRQQQNQLQQQQQQRHHQQKRNTNNDFDYLLLDEPFIFPGSNNHHYHNHHNHDHDHDDCHDLTPTEDTVPFVTTAPTAHALMGMLPDIKPVQTIPRGQISDDSKHCCGNSSNGSCCDDCCNGFCDSGDDDCVIM